MRFVLLKNSSKWQIASCPLQIVISMTWDEEKDPYFMPGGDVGNGETRPTGLEG